MSKVIKSDRTKHCSNLYILFTVLHFICLFGPFLYYIPYGFATGEPSQSVALSLAIIISLLLAAFSVFVDTKSRAGMPKTITWILIIGVLIALKEVETFIYIMSIASILDELLIIRMRAKYKDMYVANKEIDRRK